MAKKTGKAKSAAKAKAADAESDGPTKREQTRERDAELRPLIVEERAEGKKWSEIAEEHGIQETKALMLHTEATVKASEKIKPDDLDADLVTELRDEQKLAWHVIAARAGYSTVGPIKALYEEANGEGSARGRVKVAAEKPAKEATKAKGKGKKGKGKKAA